MKSYNDRDHFPFMKQNGMMSSPKDAPLPKKDSRKAPSPPKRSVGVTIIGILLILVALYNILTLMNNRDAYKPHLLKLFMEITITILGFISGIGILLLKNIFRKIALLFGFYIVYHGLEAIFFILKHPDTVRQLLRELNPRMFGFLEPIVLYLVIGFYIIPIGFAIFLIYFLRCPRVKEQFLSHRIEGVSLIRKIIHYKIPLVLIVVALSVFSFTLIKIKRPRTFSLSKKPLFSQDKHKKDWSPKKCRVVGILVTENPSVIIGGKVYYLKEFVCGGEIIDISPDKLTLRFKDRVINYKVGSVIKPQE